MAAGVGCGWGRPVGGHLAAARPSRVGCRANDLEDGECTWAGLARTGARPARTEARAALLARRRRDCSGRREGGVQQVEWRMLESKRSSSGPRRPLNRGTRRRRGRQAAREVPQAGSQGLGTVRARRTWPQRRWAVHVAQHRCPLGRTHLPRGLGKGTVGKSEGSQEDGSSGGRRRMRVCVTPGLGRPR